MFRCPCSPRKACTSFRCWRTSCVWFSLRKIRWRKKKTIELADLQSEPFLIHEAGSTSRELAERWAQENQLRWQVRMELGAIETIKEATKHNMGVSILPYRSVVREGETGELVIRELPGYVNRRHICLVYRQDDLLPYPVTSFIRFLQHRRLPDAKSPSPL
ncbi:LysR family transcriptional regulator substrate-binding protein [Brevibacillus agri]|uniref:LysR family transcriptional regulator substrate-binding protein n=1 Tax=Brevibacillus agri TaxID=51101 RepID=UPI001F527E2A